MYRLALTLVIWLFCVVSYAQCPPGPLGTGQFLDKPAGCATNGLDILFTPLYSQLEDNSQIIIDWGDGTANTIIPVGTTGVQSGMSYNTPEPHTYTELATSAGCVYTIEAYVTGPNNCYTQVETTVTSDIVIWNTDNFGDGGAGLTPNPLTFNVCAGTVTTVNFEDLSPWNCTDIAVTTSLNNQERSTQWVYGTTENITGNVLINGAIQAFPFAGAVDTHPAIVLDPQAPGNMSLDVTIPVTAVIGEAFEITLNNWNQCNPYNGGAGIPVTQTAVINIVGPPIPGFTDLNGPPPGGINLLDYCIGDNIYFDNTSTNTNINTQYLWEYFDTPTAVGIPVATSNGIDGNHTFTNGGIKAIRLTLTDPTAAGNCDAVLTQQVTVTPDVVAVVTIYDGGFGAPINPVFCQTGTGAGKVNFTVGIADESTGVNPTTEYRYEIRNAAGGLIESIPGAGFSGTPIVDFQRIYTDEDLYIVTLFARNLGSPCSSFDTDTVFVYDQPEPIFTADEACDGDLTTFSGIVDEIGGIPIRVNTDIINLYEWDFSYNVADGFNVELARMDNNDFTRALGAAGPYEVAVRATTEKGGCVSEIVTQTVTVNPNPNSQFNYNVTGDLCPGDIITFTNTSSNPALTVDYFLEVSHAGSGFFSSTLFAGPTIDLPFDNPDAATRTYDAVVRARTSDNCETLSGVRMFNVSPDETSGFGDSNYDLFNSNCSPWSSTLVVDASTQALTPDAYQWTISDNNGVVTGFPVSKVSTDPNFHELDYNLTNTSNAIITFEVVLEVTKTGVCVANDTFNLQISPQPAAAFTIMRDEDCDEVVLELEATQKGLTDYAWTYSPAPDNEFGSDDQRLISYTRDANTGADIIATINLVTTNLAGCPSDMVTMMETVEKRKPDIIPSFTIPSDTVQLPDATVLVTNTSTADAGYTYLWEYGDGQTAAVRDPAEYTYTQFGSFQIRLTITDEFCDVETFQTVVVLPADPVIDFEADTLQGCTPLTIQFTNLSQSARSGEFLWEFGDGSISQLDNPIHTYFDGGNFDVRLRGTNDVGVTLETQKDEYIQSFGRPFADFLVSARVVFIPDDEVHFRNLSENAVEYFWDFGDGETSTESDPSHAYVEEGKYDIKLVAINELGCADTLFRAAEIEAIIGGETSSPNAFTPNNSG
ncbi:MAG: PKD domain-containing protein, partial [Cyclobacteriaceae bacterium]